jgi:NADPH-dependent ferric siderophore reductase
VGLLFAETSVALSDPERIVEAFHEHFAEHIPMTRTGTGVRFEADYGNGTFSAEDGRFAVQLNCADENVLTAVKSMVAEHLIEFSGQDTLAFLWKGHGAEVREIPNLFEMRVVRAFNVTPHMRRVVLTGAQVGRLADGGMHVRLLIPPKDRPPVWPTLAANGAIAWPKGDDAVACRIYTIRSLNEALAEIEIDFVLHDGDSMPGATWGAHAGPGDIAGIIGPGGGAVPEADSYVLAGDETALPVISRMVESLPAGKKVTVFAEVADAAERQEIGSAANVEWRWLYRDGKAAGTAGLLEQALRQHTWESESADLHFFVGCEKQEARSIKALATHELKLPRASIRTAGYWQLGASADEEH